MKTIAVILPLNNPHMLSQQDLEPYQSTECYFKLSYVNTHFRELNSAEEGAQVFPLVLEEIQKAEKDGASAVIVYAFGDLGIKEGKALVSIPLMGLGKAAIHMASMLCRHQYTIIPGMLAHNSFLQTIVDEENLNRNFVLSHHDIGLSPAEMKNHPDALSRLVKAVNTEIVEHQVDTFTLGCGGFIGLAKPLGTELQKLHKKRIIVVDPIAAAFNVAKTLVA